MRVAYVIFNLRVGKGGHSFSLNATASSLSTDLSAIKVIDISQNDSFVLSSNEEACYERIPYDKPISLLKRLKSELEGEFDVIHCFDDFSYILVRMSLFGKELPLVITKCGGGNPKHYFPASDYLVCYSKENYDFFYKNNNYHNLYLIPNRLQSLERVNQNGVFDYLNNFDVNILCISRINSYYKHKITQSINLLELMKDSGIQASLTIIGTVEDASIYESMVALGKGLNVKFQTEDAFTKKASSFIHYFDHVVGTGRGFMEGAIENKIMYVPNANTKYPALIDESNIDYYSELNFSQRGRGEVSATELISRITLLYSSALEKKRYLEFINNYSNNNFLLEKAKTKYLELYKELTDKPNRFKLLNTLLGYCYFIYRVMSHKYNLKIPFFKN